MSTFYDAWGVSQANPDVSDDALITGLENVWERLGLNDFNVLTYEPPPQGQMYNAFGSLVPETPTAFQTSMQLGQGIGTQDLVDLNNSGTYGNTGNPVDPDLLDTSFAASNYFPDSSTSRNTNQSNMGTTDYSATLGRKQSGSSGVNFGFNLPQQGSSNSFNTFNFNTSAWNKWMDNI